MLKKKSFVLFSGTSNVNVWKPYSFNADQLVLFKHVVPCDLDKGCGKFVCEDNICLKHIFPIEVSLAVNSYVASLQSSRNNISQ
jgi:heptosyltransferase-2